MYSDQRLYLPDLIPLEPCEEKPVPPPRDEDEMLQEIRDARLELEELKNRSQEEDHARKQNDH